MRRPVHAAADDEASGDASSERGDGDPSGSEADADSDDELEREWAATAIQQAWALRRQQIAEAAKIKPKTQSSVCCNCFGLVEGPEERAGEAGDEGTNQEDGQAFCAACQCAMAKHPASAHHPHASPLPKLSQLVQAEARYQDQLRLLRSQQELLCRQRDEIQARKDAQAKQLAAERELARERRRHFQLAIQKKKQDEARKLQQFAVPTSSPEDDDDARHDDFAPPSSSKKRKMMMKEVIPIPLRRTVFAGDPFALPGLEKRSRSAVDGGGAPSSQPLPESTSLEQRKQSRANMVVCYAQDLTPLVDGRKPKRIIPLPAATATASCSSHSQPDPGAAKNRPPHKMQLQPQPQARSARPTTKMPKKRAAVKLRPIELSALTSSSSQHEHDGWGSSLALSLPSTKPSLSPLTAEIKPISWIYELGKGVLDEELRVSAPNSSTPTAHELPRGFDASVPLPSVREEDDNHATSLLPPQPHATFDLRLQRQLPVKTILSPSEYSSDRLASLLEKYNVSVSSKQ